MSNRQIIERALQCFANPARRQEYFELYSEDIVLHGYQGVGPGLSEVKRFYDSFWDVFPDAQVNPQEIVDKGDVLVIRYVITGNQRNAFLGIAASEQRIELAGISILHFRNGRCIERWTCSDSLVLVNQIRR